MALNPLSCINCDKKRAKGKAFCTPHHNAHEKSAWVKAWRKYQKALETNKKAVFIPPKKKSKTVDAAAPVV